MKELKGTEKQIVWAEDIRNNALESVDLYEIGLHEEGESAEDIKVEIEQAKQDLDIVEASMWINKLGEANRKYEDRKKLMMEVAKLREEGSMHTPDKWFTASSQTALSVFIGIVGDMINHDNVEWMIPIVEKQLNKKIFEGAK